MFRLPCHISKKSWTSAILCNIFCSSFHFISKSLSVSVVSNTESAKCKSVRKPHTHLPDTPVVLTIASKYFQMLPGPPGALQSALRLCNISKMYFSYWKPPGVSERMWSVNLDASISGEYQTLEGHSCWPSE